MGGSNGVSAAQRRTLDLLATLPALRGFYLAGGTAVAAYLGHRRSADLDLFTASGRVPLDGPRQAIVGALAGAAIVDVTDVAVSIRTGHGPIDLVRYAYPLLRKARPGPGGFPTAGLLDLATMKLAAIARRGIRRDFWDLDEIIERGGVSLATSARAYVERFSVAEADLYPVARALTYFADADAEPLWPAGLTAARWTAIKQRFSARAPGLAATLARRSRRRR